MTDRPTIRPAARVVGRKLVLREVESGDAAYILSLRLDPKKSAYLSPVAADVARQAAWIASYKAAGDQAYFMICTKDADGGTSAPIGTVRVYNAKGDSFEWGSWIVADGASPYVALESALLVYHYALEHLGFRNAHFEVNKENRSVWKFHENMFGARRVGESDSAYYFELDGDAIRAALQRHKRFLPETVEVAPL